MDILRLAYFQMDIAWEAPQENFLQIQKVVQQHHKEMDVLVLPEMCLTGFSMNAQKIAESWEDGRHLNDLKQLSKDYEVLLVGSLAVLDGGEFFNRAFGIYNGQVIHYYDKRHLFSLASEHKVYTQGKEQSLFKFKGWNISFAICYDLRFPVWLRNTNSYDLMLVVANWPLKRVEAWTSLLKARAIENMSYVLGVNRQGLDGNGYEYSGESACFDSLGDRISSIIDSFQVVELSKKNLLKQRNRLDFLKDQDDFEIIL